MPTTEEILPHNSMEVCLPDFNISLWWIKKKRNPDIPEVVLSGAAEVRWCDPGSVNEDDKQLNLLSACTQNPSINSPLFAYNHQGISPTITG